MANVNVNSSPEAAYVRGLKWEYDGQTYTAKCVPDTVKDKITEIFDKWGIGYFGDKTECKGTTVNMHVFAKQFKRVEFSLDRPTVTTEKTNEGV